jgi:hypothetical protein
LPIAPPAPSLPIAPRAPSVAATSPAAPLPTPALSILAASPGEPLPTPAPIAAPPQGEQLPTQPQLQALLPPPPSDCAPPGEPGPFGQAAEALLRQIGDTRDRLLFEHLCLADDPRPRDVGRALELGSSRVRELRRRAASRVEEALFPEPLGTAVARLGRELGVAATSATVDDALAALGLPPAGDVRSALCLWLAGPYEPVVGCPGWLAIDGGSVRTATGRLLAEDGGVHRTDLLRKELVRAGLAERQVDTWLAAQPVRVDGELTVLLAGPPRDVAERVLSATGAAMTVAEIVAWAGEPPERQVEWRDALRRDPRFLAVGFDHFELAEWTSTTASSAASRPPGPAMPGSCGASTVGAQSSSRRSACPTEPRRQGKRGAPARASTNSGRASTGLPPGGVGGARAAEPAGEGTANTWAVTVDDAVLAGRPGPAPEDLLAQMRVPPGASRTVATRYGPFSVCNAVDGPQRGSLRPIAMAAGATVGDVLVLRFVPDAPAAGVEVRPAVVDRQPATATA